MQQLRTLETLLKELGYQLIAVSPDRPEKLSQSLEKHCSVDIDDEVHDGKMRITQF